MKIVSIPTYSHINIEWVCNDLFSIFPDTNSIHIQVLVSPYYHMLCYRQIYYDVQTTAS